MPTASTTVRVDLGARGYDVLIGTGGLSGLGKVVRSAASPEGAGAMLACDANLPRETIAIAEHSLVAEGLRPIRYTLSATETHKSLATVEAMLRIMAEAKLDRREPVVALGGGIVGDAAGFAAAIYRRGVPVVQCPTTLLAMVDASVGGKTGVNLSLAIHGDLDLKKNMAGAFHQPRGVVVDVQTLGSLPPRFFTAGLAECIKHGMIAADWGDPHLLEWTIASMGSILSQDPGTLVELITRNVRIKAAIVGRDEREEDDSGGRALLNLGHTFAHAIEPILSLSPDGNPASAPLQHGEAVALGLVAATRTAEAARLAPAGLASQVRSIISAAGLPTAIAGLPPTDHVLGLMGHDKKVQGGRLRLILPTALGSAQVVSDPPRDAIVAGIDAIRAKG